MRKIGLLFIALLMYVSVAPAQAAVTATLDQNQVQAGQSVILTLQHDGETDNPPDLGPLKRDFDMLGRSTGSSLQIINGKMSAQVQMQLTLVPRHTGLINIPALRWGSQSTPALTLTVSGTPPPAQSGRGGPPGNTHVFLSASVDQKQPYVQSGVTLTVKLYVNEPLYQASLDLQPDNDVLIRQLGKDTQTSEVRNGQTYQVITRQYQLFPQRSGRIQLDGPVLNAQVQDPNSTQNADPFFNNAFGNSPFAGMMSMPQPLHIQASPIVLDVRPRPASAASHDWLPAQNVTLEGTWQPASGPYHVGDPLTLHLHLAATGLSASQLPDLSQLVLPDGLKAYPDQAKLSDSVQGDKILGSRDQDIVLIATQAGHYVIPAIRLYWWDTVHNAEHQIDLAAHAIDMLPGTGKTITTGAPPATVPLTNQPGPTTTPEQSSGIVNSAMKNPWLWISVALLLILAGALLAWWWRNKRTAENYLTRADRNAESATPIPDADVARKAFQQACRDNDPHAAQRHLLDWAQTVWPDKPPTGLIALSDRLNDASVKPLLEQLDRACYTSDKWQGNKLMEALSTLTTGKAGSKSGAAPLLPDLYS